MKNECWIFTFGSGQRYAGKYVKVYGTWGEAREKMVSKFGTEWGFQYSEEEWENWKKDATRMWPMETELEVIK